MKLKEGIKLPGSDEEYLPAKYVADMIGKNLRNLQKDCQKGKYGAKFYPSWGYHIPKSEIKNIRTVAKKTRGGV
jgi:hypothetical protein